MPCGIVRDCAGLCRAGLYGIVLDCAGLYGIVLDCAGLYGIVLDCMGFVGLCGIVRDC